MLLKQILVGLAALVVVCLLLRWKRPTLWKKLTPFVITRRAP